MGTTFPTEKFRTPSGEIKMPVWSITTIIEREWLAQIVAGTKKIEYRQIKSYCTQRFVNVSTPFELRLLKGMNPQSPKSRY